MRVQRVAHWVPVTRDVLLWAGAVEPTPAERAAMDREAAESRRRADERAELLDAARRELAALTDPLARAVLDLHAENERGECEGYDFEGYEAEQPEWPCRTTHVVADYLGIELP